MVWRMATVKVTFSLDETTVERLAAAASVLRKPKSEVVREAILDYAERMGRLNGEERLRMLAVFDEVVPAIPPGPADAVDAELAELWESRRTGGRPAAG